MTKKQKIKTHLLNGFSITGKTAMAKPFNLYRLSSVIHVLRNEGLKILTTMITKGDVTFASYRITKGKNNV